MWHKVMLLQMSERDKLPKLKTKSKQIKLQEETHGINEELLEDETDISTMVAQKLMSLTFFSFQNRQQM